MTQTASSILMVRPANFGYNAETSVNNAFQQKGENVASSEIAEKAADEFDAFVKLLQEKNIDVTVIEDSKMPPKPDAVFPNNWFCTLPNGELIVFPMFAPNRRIEKREDIVEEIASSFIVNNIENLSGNEAADIFLEGTGSMIFDHDNKTVYACISERTDKNLFEKFAKEHGYEPVSFLSVDDSGMPIYHTNVMMHIGETYVVICLDSIPKETEKLNVVQHLEKTGHKIISVTQEQVKHFAGNMIQVKNKFGEKFTVLSQTAFDSLSLEQKHILSVHTNLLPVNISTIETIGGGSARCMIAEIFLKKKVSDF